jgi:hypothetical protein
VSHLRTSCFNSSESISIATARRGFLLVAPTILQVTGEYWQRHLIAILPRETIPIRRESAVFILMPEKIISRNRPD